MLPKEITEAIETANELIDNLLANDAVDQQKQELSKLTKAQLIEKVMELSGKKASPSIEQLVYAILEEPTCAWLTWDMVASIVRNKIPKAETSAKGIRWYSSKGLEKRRNVVPRVKASRIAQLLAENIK